jgi:hypothetical protein
MSRFDVEAHLDQARLLRLIRPGLKLLGAYIEWYEAGDNCGWKLRLDSRPNYGLWAGGSLVDVGHGLIDLLAPSPGDPCERILPPWFAAKGRAQAVRLRRRLPAPMIPSDTMGEAEIERRRLEIKLGRMPR